MYRSRRHYSSAGGILRIGITCYPTYGGSGIVATELGLELATRGRNDVRICITYSNPIRLDPGIPRHSLSTRWRFRNIRCSSIRLIVQRWRRGCPDVAASYRTRTCCTFITRHTAFHLGAARAANDRGEAAAAVYHDALHGTRYHAGRGGSFLFSGSRNFPLKQSDGVTAISEDLRG